MTARQVTRRGMAFAACIAVCVAALAVALAVAVSSEPGKIWTGTNVGVTTLPGLADRLGCTFHEDTDEHELYTSDQGECGMSWLYLFGSAKTRDSWLRVAAGFGGAVLVGPDWVIADDDPAVLDAARARVGGEVRTG